LGLALVNIAPFFMLVAQGRQMRAVLGDTATAGVVKERFGTRCIATTPFSSIARYSCVSGSCGTGTPRHGPALRRAQSARLGGYATLDGRRTRWHTLYPDLDDHAPRGGDRLRDRNPLLLPGGWFEKTTFVAAVTQTVVVRLAPAVF
jgi:hypothetical protein